MPEIKLIACDSIIVDRENRQRRDLDVSGLMDSIQQNTDTLPATLGLIQPIVLRNGLTLVAGERRLTAFKALGRPEIPAYNIEDLDERSAYIIELEENIKRTDISWPEKAKAFKFVHDSYAGEDPEWTQSRTALRLGVSEATVTQYIQLAEEAQKDPTLLTIAKATTAYETVKRRVDRQLDDVLTSMPIHVKNFAMPQKLDQSGVMQRPVTKVELRHQPAASSLILGDFAEWAKAYNGPRFNLIHCDFPYGASSHKPGSQVHAGGDHQSYEDTDEIFYDLCNVLVSSMANVVAQSAHIFLWFQTSEWGRTLEFFKSHAKKQDLRVFDVPLIWHKSDNSGVVSDASRRARHIYETAFIMSRGDRKIVNTVSDVHSSSITRAIHPSEKPEPMLRHFLKMLVSPTTRFLDPTAGSGTSLRAAESLGAEFVFGLEKDKHFHTEAVAELDRFRKKRAAEAILNKKETAI